MSRERLATSSRLLSFCAHCFGSSIESAMAVVAIQRKRDAYEHGKMDMHVARARQCGCSVLGGVEKF